MEADIPAFPHDFRVLIIEVLQQLDATALD